MRVRPKQFPYAPFNPANNDSSVSPRWASSAWSETHQACVGGLFTLSSRGSNLRAICCYLGNVLRTLHGHICTRALTSSLFLAPARRWRLLWWCHTGFQNKSDCLSWVTLPARFPCHVCLCLFIRQTGFFFRAASVLGLVLSDFHLQLYFLVFSKCDQHFQLRASQTSSPMQWNQSRPSKLWYLKD